VTDASGPPPGLSFDAAADVYERSRPPYPQAAIDWLVPATAQRLLDLAAGTGKLTRQLIDGRRTVTAVEPLPGMRAVGEVAAPAADFREGTAEQIPLLDASVDVVLVAQAWHWVDPVRAVPEVARVLAPSGQLGLLWNDQDVRVPWVRELSQIMHAGAEPPDIDEPVIGGPFGPLETRQFEWVHPMTGEALLDAVASRSYFITAPPSRQRATLDRVRELLAADPALKDRQRVGLPFVTRCYRTTLIA
jgi:SAM-dependent methyltransferase